MVIDVYRDPKIGQRNLLNVLLYISFFPQLIAGPIVRFDDIVHQIRHRVHSVDKISGGICRFVRGLGKKVLLANTMAVIADKIFKRSRRSGECDRGLDRSPGLCLSDLL